MVAELQARMQDQNGLTAAVASLTALCEDEKRQRPALAEQVASLQQQLTERDQTVADMQTQLQSAREDLRAARSTAECTAASLEQALRRETAALAEMGDAMQRAAEAEQELVRLSSVVADLEQRLAATRSVATAPPPPPAPTSASDSLAVAQVGSQCDAVITQFGHVPALRNAIQHRDELQAQLEAAETGDDFVLVGTLGEQLDALNLKVVEQPLSEEDYLTMFERHAALVQKVTDTCRELTKSRAYAEVKTLGVKLQELKALDVSALPQSWANDPVLPPARPAPSTSAEEGEDGCANDPVYVPPHAGEITLA
jgi:DNA repair exonuclease SbcCD ATPase subunit